jgi:amidase
MTELALLSATELAAKLRDGDISSLELTDHYIDRIERSDDALNAVVVKDFERAREAARQADAAKDKSRPLHGLAVASAAAAKAKPGRVPRCRLGHRDIRAG